MRSALSWPARPSAVLRDLAQSPDLPAPTRPTRRPTSDPAACWSLQCHQPQHRLLPTSLCRVEPLEQVPLERLDAGLGDGVAPTKQLETPLPGRRLCSRRCRTARSTWAVEHQVQAAPAREPAPLFAQPAPLVAPALARCAAAGQQQAQVQQPAAQPPVEAWPEAPGMGCTRRQDLLANRPSPYPPRYKGKVLKTSVGSVSAT